MGFSPFCAPDEYRRDPPNECARSVNSLRGGKRTRMPASPDRERRRARTATPALQNRAGARASSGALEAVETLDDEHAHQDLVRDAAGTGLGLQLFDELRIEGHGGGPLSRA